jgi:hypothetical protein
MSRTISGSAASITLVSANNPVTRGSPGEDTTPPVPGASLYGVSGTAWTASTSGFAQGDVIDVTGFVAAGRTSGSDALVPTNAGSAHGRTPRGRSARPISPSPATSAAGPASPREPA